MPLLWLLSSSTRFENGVGGIQCKWKHSLSKKVRMVGWSTGIFVEETFHSKSRSKPAGNGDKKGASSMSTCVCKRCHNATTVLTSKSEIKLLLETKKFQRWNEILSKGTRNTGKLRKNTKVSEVHTRPYGKANGIASYTFKLIRTLGEPPASL